MQIQKVSNIQSQNNAKPINKNNNEVGFKGLFNVPTEGYTAVLDYLATNPVWGATAVDVGSMGTPRCIVDTYNRGWGAGGETAFREYTSTVNDASVGLYGLAAGAVLGAMLTKHGVKNPKRIFASPDSINVHTDMWKTNEGNVDKYINNYVENLRGFNPQSEKADAKGFVKIENGALKDSIIEDMKSLANDGLSDKDRKVVEKRLTARLIEATGSESELVLKHGEKSVSSSAATVTDDFYRMTKALKEFGNIDKTEKLVQSLKRFGKGRALLGLGSAMAVSACFQPINVWMTKKRTGSDGFAGMEGREKDNSFGFKMMKLGSAAAMAGIALTTLQAFKPAKVLDKLLFKSGIPTLDQFKGLYAITIISRMLVARDKDELSETDRKDSLGFLNWLVIGNLVEKGLVMGMDDKKDPIMKYNKEAHKNGFIYKHFGETVDKFVHGSVSTRKEIIADEFAKQGMSMVNEEGKAKSMRQLTKELLSNEACAKAAKKLKIKNRTQIANYVYTCAALGAGIPYMNIKLTEKAQNKRLAKRREKAMSAENMAFVYTQTSKPQALQTQGNKNIA